MECGTRQGYWRVYNAEYTFNLSNYKKIKRCQRVHEMIRIGELLEIIFLKFIYLGIVKIAI